jgi:thiosulfate/3-mercaptopyruvate sulfurtransferase
MLSATHAEPLVETDWLAEHLLDPDVRVVEVDVSAAAYDTGHIEGAVLWNVYTDLLQPNYRVIERGVFADLLGRSGIQPGSRVVVYGYAAALGFWMLAYYGHRRVSLLNGSRGKWIQSERPLSTAVPSIIPTTYAVADLEPPQEDIRATHELVARAIGDPDRRLMDVRSIAEYTGARFWPSLPPQGDQRGGHVPGAIPAPIEETWAADGRFKDPAELLTLYSSKGVAHDKEIITYCAVGGRAAQAWFVLTHLLGYPRVRVYDGSWVEWGTLPGVPVER